MQVDRVEVEYTISGVEDLVISAEDDYVNLTNSRQKDMSAVMGCANLKELVLRQNMIKSLCELGDMPFKNCLEKLDVYINLITSLKGLDSCSNLESVDLSFNEIRVISCEVEKLRNLKELYLANNKIKAIECVNSLDNLTLLELGSNRIRKIENLEGMCSLESLWLGRNKITEVTGLESLYRLQKLDIQSNRLTSLGNGLSGLINLQELYLAHNGLSDTKGLESLINLTTLDLTHNQVSKLDGLESLVSLEELWISENSIEDFEELKSIKSNLETIYLEHNPVAKKNDYEMKVRAMLPSLTQLDALRLQ